MQHKRNINIIKFRKKDYGDVRRKNYAKEILYKEPIFPKPLEYSDIDNAFKDFVENTLEIIDFEGKKIPTFTLYSNQRFSEYSQTWKHTDSNMNLYLNFKTINRENNPMNGTNQGGLWNIPGERSYPILLKTVLDDNGTESIQRFSMKQPYAVDLIYRINLFTNNYELLNIFNEKVNECFKSRQFYIRPNGHFIPLILDNTSDDSQYNIDDRKFFSQGYTIKALAYIIHESDFKVEEFPKRIISVFEGDSINKKTDIDINEYEDEYSEQKIEMKILFKPYNEKITFVMDSDVYITDFESENIRNFRININDTPIFYKNGFSIKDGDEVKLKINKLEKDKESLLSFIGNNGIKIKNEVADNVYNEIPSKIITYI